MKNILLALIILSFLSSCATIMGGGNRHVEFSSFPSGATVTVKDRYNREVYKSTTPARVLLRSSEGFFKRSSYQVSFTLEGYQEKIVPINYSVSGWYWLNIISWDLLGMLIVDPATGAMYRPKQTSFNESLVAIRPALQQVSAAPATNFVESPQPKQQPSASTGTYVLATSLTEGQKVYVFIDNTYVLGTVLKVDNIGERAKVKYKTDNDYEEVLPFTKLYTEPNTSPKTPKTTDGYQSVSSLTEGQKVYVQYPYSSSPFLEATVLKADNADRRATVKFIYRDDTREVEFRYSKIYTKP